MRPFLVLALFALLAAPAAAQQQPIDTTPTIAADGQGTATLTPDVADFSAGVERVAPTSRGARNATNRRIDAVLKAVKAGGVADADIRTVGLTIQRERVGKRKRVRYRAQQTIVIHVRAVAGLAPLIDAVASAGADSIGDPEFGFADPSLGRTLATRAALADARRRADDAAAVAGLRITGVRSVDLDPSGDSGFSDSSGASGGAQKSPGNTPTTVLPGTQDFVESVRVVYTAAPAV
ncbi:SIMPL domain-containing protein [Solirubrobacter ginsenosidimutans]|uniref:SIMPL domain-containing protein n=1 Tax=Solirubrobacter ginsenosidimutans TaxID=490573 RepID=A0A9X3S519_9ACTN|nr:SIMPL domain-containing protein [Solirubrobacter ginsenosidimutans]MDA0165107.1 SIMPL domain-containing protein [Solirubrobacter ginsenosidimutans]